MENINLIKRLIQLANKMDQRGLVREASQIDNIIKKAKDVGFFSDSEIEYHIKNKTMSILPITADNLCSFQRIKQYFKISHDYDGETFSYNILSIISDYFGTLQKVPKDIKEIYYTILEINFKETGMELMFPPCN